MPSFDIVSKINHAELDNALHQTQKEIAQRYDFKDTGTSIERTAEGIVLQSNSEGRVEAAFDVLQGKLVKRGVSLKHVDPQASVPAGGQTVRQLVKLVEGIDRDRARRLVDAVKETKLKVQASIQGDTVRVSGKNKDELQLAIRAVRAQDFGIELQFLNFRD